MLNPASPLPLYQQLAELLGRDIQSGSLPQGARLPSEPELARQHGIGRPTVRQATELLVQRGLVERKRGSGTYVRSAPKRVDLFSLGGTLESFREGGLSLQTRLLGRVSEVSIDAEGDNPFAGRSALLVTRVGSVADKPVLLERLYFDRDVFAGLSRLSLAGASLSRLVEERFYLKPTHAEQSFRVAVPPEDVRLALSLRARAALLLVKRALFFPRAPRAVFGELYCRTDELVFSQTIGAETRHD
ncbi:MAG: GntR family transcriptional regulator [Polyangiaceae bacterium]|jgi:GntR family transcriptional regulator|nr:GntR family transcriptional regulator [Polyangiaceae bacterium]